MVFGQRAPQSPPSVGFPIHYTAHSHDDLSPRALYSATDAMVIPSLQGAFGQTASEAHGIAWVLAQPVTGPSGGLLGQQARERAAARFAAPVVAAQYRAVYRQIVSSALPT